MEIHVSYQGVEGSYSSMAAHEYFGDVPRTGFPTFDAVVCAVRDDAATHALLPIENSTAGRVADLHHLLPKSDLTAVGEHFLPVRHALIGLEGSTLSTVTHAYSHREALAQCVRTLRDLNITPVPFADTAQSVAHIIENNNPRFAAIASTYAATLHQHVQILKENIQDVPDNVTRFLILSKNPLNKPCIADCITSIVYNVPDSPAALYESLGVFARNGINIIKLESFVPMQRHKDAHFYLECTGASTQEPLRAVLQELEAHTRDMCVLGSYEKSAYRARFAQ